VGKSLEPRAVVGAAVSLVSASFRPIGALGVLMGMLSRTVVAVGLVGCGSVGTADFIAAVTGWSGSTP